MVSVGCSQRPKSKTAETFSAWAKDTSAILNGQDSTFRIKKEDVLCVYEEGKICPCAVNPVTDTVLKIEGICIAIHKNTDITPIHLDSSEIKSSD